MSTENQAQENKMGVMPENRLLLTMAIPIVISMLVQALYNVVDSVFVAQLSEDALNAVSLAFPVQNLMIAVAVGTGVGINALLSKSLGEGNQAKADRTAMNGLFLSALSFLVFAVIGLTCSRLYFTIQTDIQRIVDYGESYMMICCVCSFGVFFQITLERTLQATGRTLYTMFTQATGAIINIILDPIMIFGLFGFPRMEVARSGAGYCYRTDRGGDPGPVLQFKEESGPPSVGAGLPTQPHHHRRYLQRGHSLHRHAVHRLGDGLWDEPDPDRLHPDGHRRLWRVLQAPVLHLHARLWIEQWDGAHRGL